MPRSPRPSPAFVLPLLLGLACGGEPRVLDANPPRAPQAQAPGEAPPQPGRFEPAGQLREPRLGLAAAALGPDQVLVTGGAATPGGSGCSSAELYTPSIRAALPVQAMAAGRTGHALTRVDGVILVTGGLLAPGAGPDAEAYDADAGRFVPAGAMVQGRRGHSATGLGPTPGLLVAGGLDGAGAPARTLERYHPGTGTFEPVGTAELAPGHSATLLPDGQVLLVSRTGPAGAWRPWAARYAPATGVLVPTAGQPRVAREGQRALFLPDARKVLLLGGRNERGPVADVEWYDPATDAFLAGPAPMPTPREDFGVALLPGGQVLVAGGSTDGRTATAGAERFDPASQRFAAAGDLLRPRRDPCLVQLPAGPVLVLGGANEVDGCLRDVERYVPDPATRSSGRPGQARQPDTMTDTAEPEDPGRPGPDRRSRPRERRGRRGEPATPGPAAPGPAAQPDEMRGG